MASSYHAFDVITPFHAISSLSWCISQAEAGDVATLHTVPAMHGRYLLDECAFVTSSGVRVEVVRQACRGSNARIATCLLRRLWPRHTPGSEGALYLGHHTYFKPTLMRCFNESLSGRKIITFSFEEGIGSYHSLEQEREVAAREGKRFPIGKYWLKRLFANRIFLDRRWGLLDSSDNEDVRHWHRVAAGELGRHVYETVDENKNCEKDGVLFFTSPLVRLGLISSYQNEVLVGRIREFFLQRGQDLYLKAHPLDQQAYGHLVDSGCLVETEAPAEVHLIQCRYAGVAGINSGALLTASMMFDIPAINFYPWLPELARQKLTLGVNLSELFSRFTSDCQQGESDIEQ